jgi:hypothetical protein
MHMELPGQKKATLGSCQRSRRKGILATADFEKTNAVVRKRSLRTKAGSEALSP